MDGHSITYRTTTSQEFWLFDALIGSPSLWIVAGAIVATTALAGGVLAAIDLRHRIRRAPATSKRAHLLLSTRIYLAIAATGISAATLVLVIGSIAGDFYRAGDVRHAQNQQIAAELQQWEQVRKAIGDIPPADLRAGYAVSFASLINPETPHTQQCDLIPADNTDHGVTVTLICDNAVIPHPRK